MTDIWSIQEIIQCATLGIPKRMKNAISISFAFSFDFFYQKWQYHFRGTKNKKPFKIILHIGWVTSHQSWVVNPIKEIMSRSNSYKWLFNFWLPFHLWRLVTCPTCKIISNGFLFCVSRKWYFHFWSKC